MAGVKRKKLPKKLPKQDNLVQLPEPLESLIVSRKDAVGILTVNQSNFIGSISQLVQLDNEIIKGLLTHIKETQ